MTSTILQATPETLPITTHQFQLLVNQGVFDGQTGQIELIYGRIVRMNPQGPVHSDPIDELTRWSIVQADERFRVRIEKPIEIAKLHSTPEPDVAWASLRRYADRHPTPDDIHLLIEVSGSSKTFDRGEKLRLYAEARIREYWIVDIATKTVELFTDSDGTTYRQSVVFGMGEEVRPRCLPTASLSVDRLFSTEIV